MSAGVALLCAAGCAQSPARLGFVNPREWAAVQSLPEAAGDEPAQRALMRRLVAPFARRHGLDLVLDEDQLLVAKPDLDVTLLVLGKELRPPRAGERIGVVDLAQALQRTREGVAAQARIAAERDADQRELDQLLAALKAQFGGDVRALPEPQKAEFRLRQRALTQRQRQLVQRFSAHERATTVELLGKLRPELEQLAAAHGLDAVLDVHPNVERLFYRGRTRFPPRGIDLTDELIRLHDQHVP